MPYLLFVVYFFASAIFIFRSSLVRNTGLPVRYWILFFIIKVTAGCYYGFWYSNPKNITTSDTWRFQTDALDEYRLLFSQPAEYFSNFFRYGAHSGGGLLEPHGYWNDLKDLMMVKIVSLMDVLSGGYYYVNVLIYSFVTFFGFVFLYLACKNILQRAPSSLTTFAILYTPSCLFWTSGLHKDGFMLLFLCILFWCFTQMTAANQLRRRYILLMLFSFTALFLLRNYVAGFIIPAFTAWLITHKYNISPMIAFPAMAATCILVFFISPFLHHSIDLTQSLVERKMAFEALSGNSRLPYIPLQSSPGSYISNLPMALNHALLRPYLWQSKTIMEKAASMENVLIIVIIALSVIMKKTTACPELPRFQGMLIFLSFAIFILIGYIVPFSGAIVRYRSVFLMLLVTAASLSLSKTLKIK